MQQLYNENTQYILLNMLETHATWKLSVHFESYSKYEHFGTNFDLFMFVIFPNVTFVPFVILFRAPGQELPF